MTIYGLYGITHGWGRLLTLMSPDGAAALRAALGDADDVELVEREGGLIQAHAKREGALDRLIRAHGVVVLDKQAWDAKKAELGAAIAR